MIVRIAAAWCVGCLIYAGGVMAQAADPENTIQVAVKGFRSDNGVLIVSVFDDGDGFPGNSDHIIKTMKVKIEKDEAKCEIKGLKPGVYAITVHHDEDGNGKLKTNVIKIPKEGLGASNNAKMRFGPPKWKDAKFVVGETPLEQNITLKYF